MNDKEKLKSAKGLRRQVKKWVKDATRILEMANKAMIRAGELEKEVGDANNK